MIYEDNIVQKSKQFINDDNNSKQNIQWETRKYERSLYYIFEAMAMTMTSTMMMMMENVFALE